MDSKAIKNLDIFTIYAYGNDFYSQFFCKLLKKEVPFAIIIEKIDHFQQLRREGDILLLMNSEFDRADTIAVLEGKGLRKARRPAYEGY